ncbi:MAG: DUF6502 family protein [Gammaproteobacteria bacterium]|nr:DUF6502 family protein [Gammaproteobacteria bacterium]
MDKIKPILLLATANILRPIIRILLKHGVSHSEFNELSRRVFVDVGFDDFSIAGRKQTNSRVAVLTGLSRKEVLRIRMLPSLLEEKEDVPLNRASRVISGWLRDKDFCDTEGNPLSLPWRETGTFSFTGLVKRYSGDITAGAVYDELERVGAIEKTEDGRILLKQIGYIPEKSVSRKIEIMGECAKDFLGTLENNLDDTTPPRFQRSVVYTDLPQPVVEEFEELSQKKAMNLLLELNEWLAEKKEKLKKPPTIPYRTGFGVYFFKNNQNKVAANSH